MKKTWIVFMAVCVALAFTACSKSSQDTKTTAQTSEAETQPETVKEKTTTAPAVQAAPGMTSEFKILTGKVVGVADDLSNLTMKKGDADVEFDLKGVDIETSYALDTDVSVSVIYKGEISGADTTNAKVVLVLDASENMEVKTVTGSVKDQAMSTFTIETALDGDMGFLKDNCEGLDSGVLGQGSDDSNGSGVKVKVTYVTVFYDAGSQSNFPLKVEAVI